MRTNLGSSAQCIGSVTDIQAGKILSAIDCNIQLEYIVIGLKRIGLYQGKAAGISVGTGAVQRIFLKETDSVIVYDFRCKNVVDYAVGCRPQCKGKGAVRCRYIVCHLHALTGLVVLMLQKLVSDNVAATVSKSHFYFVCRNGICFFLKESIF